MAPRLRGGDTARVSGQKFLLVSSIPVIDSVAKRERGKKSELQLTVNYFMPSVCPSSGHSTESTLEEHKCEFMVFAQRDNFCFSRSLFARTVPLPARPWPEATIAPKCVAASSPTNGRPIAVLASFEPIRRTRRLPSPRGNIYEPLRAPRNPRSAALVGAHSGPSL